MELLVRFPKYLFRLVNAGVSVILFYLILFPSNNIGDILSFALSKIEQNPISYSVIYAICFCIIISVGIYINTTLISLGSCFQPIIRRILTRNKWDKYSLSVVFMDVSEIIYSLLRNHSRFITKGLEFKSWAVPGCYCIEVIQDNMTKLKEYLDDVDKGAVIPFAYQASYSQDQKKFDSWLNDIDTVYTLWINVILSNWLALKCSTSSAYGVILHIIISILIILVTIPSLISKKKWVAWMLLISFSLQFSFGELGDNTDRQGEETG